MKEQPKAPYWRKREGMRFFRPLFKNYKIMHNWVNAKTFFGDIKEMC